MDITKKIIDSVTILGKFDSELRIMHMSVSDEEFK